MAYSSNYKPVLAETGDYEATISNADVRTTNSGSQYLNLAFTLPNNIRVYKKIWRDFIVTSEFNHEQVAELLTALNINDEIETDFALIQEFNDKTQKEENNIKSFKQIEEELPF